MVGLLATELRMTDYVLTGLVKRRAELAGEIEATHDRLRKMIEDLEKLDSVILQFDPTHQVEAIRPKAFRLRRVRRGGRSAFSGGILTAALARVLGGNKMQNRFDYANINAPIFFCKTIEHYLHPGAVHRGAALFRAGRARTTPGATIWRFCR